MSFYAMALIGTAPFGSLLAGALAARIGAAATIGAGGVVCLGVAGWFAVKLPVWREQVRPIYERLGILPEVANGRREGASRMGPAKD